MRYTTVSDVCATQAYAEQNVRARPVPEHMFRGAVFDTTQ
jgi:hypothetical protein